MIWETATQKELKTTTDLCIADDDWLQEQYELSMYHYTTKPDNRREQPQHKGKSNKKEKNEDISKQQTQR